MRKAVVLFSGGLDSTTCLAIACSQGFTCYALSFDYGQRNKIEIEMAKKNALVLGAVAHKVLHLPMGDLGGSAMTDSRIDILPSTLLPGKSNSSVNAKKDSAKEQDVPVFPRTYVPARNTVFLAFALSFSEVIGAQHIFIGVNAVDYSGYPDCRLSFIEAFEKVANLGTGAGVQGNGFCIHAPLIELSKADIVKTGLALGIDYSLTLSCYRPDNQGRACGSCDSCVFRRKGFREAGVVDPTKYIPSIRY